MSLNKDHITVHSLANKLLKLFLMRAKKFSMNITTLNKGGEPLKKIDIGGKQNA